MVEAPRTLRQYALIADGERGALVGHEGDLAFLCAPCWHDDAVFSGRLGGPGGYAVSPCERRHVWGGHDEQDSPIWRSRWVTTTAVIESRDARRFTEEYDVVQRQLRGNLPQAFVHTPARDRARARPSRRGRRGLRRGGPMTDRPTRTTRRRIDEQAQAHRGGDRSLGRYRPSLRAGVRGGG